MRVALRKVFGMGEETVENRIENSRTSLFIGLLKLSVLLLIIAQIAAVILIADERPVNADALSAAAEAFYEGRFIASAPVMSIWALIGRLCRTNPLILIFTVTPVILIPGYYYIYMLLAGRLFEKQEHRWFMLLCICILNLWGYQSEYFAPYTLLCSWYMGTSLVVHGLMPFVVYKLTDRCRIPEYRGDGDYYGNTAASENGTDINASEEINDYYREEEEDMRNHKVINSRNLAIALLVVVIMLIGSVLIMNRKINNLYETTVNLQQEVEELRSE